MKVFAVEDLPNAPAMELYKADDTALETFGAGTSLASWSNEHVDGGSGRGKTYAQATAANQPTYNVSYHGASAVVFSASQSMTYGYPDYLARGMNNWGFFTVYVDPATAPSTGGNLIQGINGSSVSFAGERQPAVYDVGSSGYYSAPANSFAVAFNQTGFVATGANTATAGWHMLLWYFKADETLCIQLDHGASTCTASPVMRPYGQAGVGSQLGGGMPMGVHNWGIGEDFLTPTQIDMIDYVQGAEVNLNLSSVYSAANPPMIPTASIPAAHALPEQPDEWHSPPLCGSHYVLSLSSGLSACQVYNFAPGASFEPGLYTLTATDSSHFTVISPKNENLGVATTNQTFTSPQLGFYINSAIGTIAPGMQIVLWPCACAATNVNDGVPLSTAYPTLTSWPITEELAFTGTAATGQPGADILSESQPLVVTANIDGSPRIPFRSPMYEHGATPSSETYTLGSCRPSASDSTSAADPAGPHMEINVSGSGTSWSGCAAMGADPVGVGATLTYGSLEFQWSNDLPGVQGSPAVDPPFDSFVGAYSVNDLGPPSWNGRLEVDMFEIKQYGAGQPSFCFTLHDHKANHFQAAFGAPSGEATSTLCTTVRTTAPWSNYWTKNFDNSVKTFDGVLHSTTMVLTRETHSICVFLDHYRVGCIAEPRQYWGQPLNPLFGIETDGNISKTSTGGPYNDMFKMYQVVIQQEP